VQGLETVGGKTPDGLDRAPRGHVGIHEPRLGMVGTVAEVGTGRSAGDLAGRAVRVCGRGSEGISRPRGKRLYQARGRTVDGHMREKSEAPA
jgi:hypothetical protein